MVGYERHAYKILYFVGSGDSHPDEISVLAVDRDLVFTGCKNIVRAFTRGKQVCTHITVVVYVLAFLKRSNWDKIRIAFHSS